MAKKAPTVKVNVRRAEPGTPGQKHQSRLAWTSRTLTFDASNPDPAMQRLRELFDEFRVTEEERHHIASEFERQSKAALAQLSGQAQ